MKKRIKYFIAGAALIVAGAVFMAAGNPDLKLGRNIEMLINVFRDVNLFYVDETDPDRLMQDAAAGMMNSLDPYTVYMSAEEMEDFAIMTTGKYGGIGSLIRKKGDYVTIAQPYKNSPADRAGLRIGDKILEVDGVNAVGLEVDEVSARMKGDAGTVLTMKLRKHLTDEEVVVKITRERIVLPAIPYYGWVNDSIGYIQHDDFSEDCSADMRQAIMELRGSGRLRGLVLDYRNNGGGIMQEAVDILSMFVAKGTEVVSMRGRTDEMSAVFRTANDPIDTELPLVVLTGSSSASAAEIVSGALQDLDRAVLIGQRTFGKGLVQSTRPTGYNSYLKVTTAKYYIPSGRCIQALDYAHRNEDGSVSSVPDSLISEFTTRGGRKVYDGGGVMPDIKCESEYISPFTVIVYSRGYIEEFADDFYRRNPQPVDLETFAVTDEIYGEFTRFMEDKEVQFRSESRLALDALRERAERELYYDQISDEIAAIESKLRDDKQTSLALYREQIAELLENEIILRYHYSQGVTQYRLRNDDEVSQAAQLLADPERYNHILTEQDTERK